LPAEDDSVVQRTTLHLLIDMFVLEESVQVGNADLKMWTMSNSH
jgi:hypothetical protein